MGNVRLYGSTSGYTELAPPAVAPDGVLSLPSGTGTIATQDYAASAGGLVHINTTTFSAVSSVSLDNVFTSDYESYMVSLVATGSTDVLIRWRLRLSGTDATTSAYTQAYLNPGNGVATDNNAFFIYPSTSVGSGQLHLYNPQAASVTAANVAGGNYGQLIFAAIRHNVATAYDGITIYMPSGTMTGKVRVYGYKNA